MVRDTSSFPTVIATTVSTSTGFLRDMGNTFGVTEVTIRAISSKEFAMVLVFGRRITKRTVRPIAGTTFSIESQATVSIFGKTESTIKVIFSRTSDMAMESSIVMVHLLTRVCGKMARRLLT
jgi:hypothetical protein